MVADEEEYRTQPIPTKREKALIENDNVRTWLGWLLFGLAAVVVITITALAISSSDRANIKSRTDLANQCITSGGSWTSHGDCIKK